MFYALCGYTGRMTAEVVPLTGPRRLRLGRQLVAEIRAEMGRRQMSGVKLAEEVGVKQPYVSRRLTLKVPLDADSLELFARALGTTVTKWVAAAEAASEVDGSSVTGHGSPKYHRAKNGDDRVNRTSRHLRVVPRHACEQVEHGPAA